MIGNFKRFDMQRPPIKQRRYLTLVIWVLSFPMRWYHRTQIKKIGMEGIKPPYLLISNHNAFLDFIILSTVIFPRRASYVVAIDGYIGREWLLRNVGAICVRKFTTGTTIVRNMIHSKNQGVITVLYPEARYSLCGTNAVLPDSVGKLIKKMNIPVATLILSGHHVNSPVWALGNRGVKTSAELKLLYTAEQVQSLSYQELNEGLRGALVYDDFRWQKENGIVIKYAKRAEGLEHVLYQCPHCKTEYQMASEKNRLFCKQCEKVWEMDEYGALAATQGETEFTHIPDWYEWEREQVRQQIEEGTYSLSCQAHVRSLPNARKFQDLGKAQFAHTMDGFHVKGQCGDEPYEEFWPSKSQYSCHIEYNYLGKFGDCVDLNTLQDTLYIYPEGADFSVTKISLATEELYKKSSAPAKA